MIKVISIRRAPNRLIPISKSVNGVLELNFSLIYPNSVFFSCRNNQNCPSPTNNMRTHENRINPFI